MKKETQNNRKRSNFRRTRDRRRRKTPDLPNLRCPLCHKQIHDLYTAICFDKTERPAHFDCIIKEIKRIEEIGPNEKLCYLGNGSFGIISFRNPSSPIKFLIRKRIQYEDLKITPDWKQILPITIKEPKVGNAERINRSDNDDATVVIDSEITEE
ncbi:MAG: hypothetical protein JXR70_05250 [Spirochaetales bacterium]|nr:hypothetical protein [Spirochaetales bacterium]